MLPEQLRRKKHRHSKHNIANTMNWKLKPMKPNFKSAISLLALLLASMFAYSIVAPATEPLAEERGKELATRQFEFTYRATIAATNKDANYRIWIPIAKTNEDQEIKILHSDFPVEPKMSTDSTYGNAMFYFESKGDDLELAFEVIYEVNRHEVKRLPPSKSKSITTVEPKTRQATAGDGDGADIEIERKSISESEREFYLAANRLVPTQGKSIDLFDTFLDQQAQSISTDDSEAISIAKSVYSFVSDHMTYDKSKFGYGNGDVLWACDSKTGNCTDFHSLFISVARNRKIPAKFEIGFPIPIERGNGKIGGYHCWAKFFDEENGWIPVDISEADKHPELADYYFGSLSENRIQFSTGRDINLQPKQASEPLNYFIYPHVEVDGRLIPKTDLKLEFAYRDLNSPEHESAIQKTATPESREEISTEETKTTETAATELENLRSLGATWTEQDGVITQLKADCKDFEDAHYKFIGSIKTLKMLSISGKSMNDDQLEMLTGLSELESIMLNGTQLTDDGYRHFASFEKLKSLALFHPSRDNKDFTGAGLSHLKELSKLERLTFAGATAGDTAFEAIGQLGQLREFREWHNWESAKAFKHLLKLKELKSLKLGQRLPGRGRSLDPSFDDSTLEFIAQMKSLETLEFQEARLSYHGLEKLRELPALKELKLKLIDISKTDVDKLSDSLPSTKVTWEPLTDEENESVLVNKLKL